MTQSTTLSGTLTRVEPAAVPFHVILRNRQTSPWNCRRSTHAAAWATTRPSSGSSTTRRIRSH